MDYGFAPPLWLLLLGIALLALLALWALGACATFLAFLVEWWNQRHTG